MQDEESNPEIHFLVSSNAIQNPEFELCCTESRMFCTDDFLGGSKLGSYIVIDRRFLCLLAVWSDRYWFRTLVPINVEVLV